MQIRFLIPLLLSAILILSTSFTYFTSLQNINHNIRTSNTSLLLSKAQIMQNSIEELYRLSDIEDINQLFTGLGSLPQVKLAMFIDNNNAIISSIHSQDLGKSFIEGVTGILPETQQNVTSEFNQVRQTLRSKIHQYDNAITAIYPVTLGSSKGSLRPDKIGLLIIHEDLSELFSEANNILQQQVTPLIVFDAILIVALILFLNFIFTRRLQSITNITQEIAQGNFQHRLQENTSKNELSFLSRSINKMANVIEKDRVEIQQNKKKFQSLVESTSDWIWEIDIQCRFTYASPKIKELLGYEPEELIGRSAFDLMSEKEAAHVVEGYRKLIQNHQPFSGMININQHKNGHEVILESSGVPLFDPEGNWSGYRGIDRDVTERRQSEQESLRLTSALDASINEIFMFNVNDLYFTYVNPAAVKNLGYSMTALKEMTPVRIKPEYTESSFNDVIKPLIQKEQSQLIFETLHQRADESTYPVEIRLQLIDQIQPPQFLAVINDISERKQAENDIHESETRFYTLARLAPVGIFQTDAEGKCIYCNETWLNITGQSLEQALGDGWADALHPDDKALVYETWTAAAKEHKPFKLEYRFLQPDGNTIWVYGQAEANCDESGNILNYIGTITNIDERKIAELEHFEAQRRLRKQQRATLLFAQKQKHVINDLHIVYRQLCESIAGNLDIERVSVWLLNESGDALRCANLFIASTKQHETNMVLNIKDYPAYFEALKYNRVISADDACTNPDTMEFCERHLKPNNISSMMDSPLRDGSGNVIGVLSYEHVGEQRQWHSDEKNFSSAFADMLSLSIELYARTQAENELKTYRDHLEVMVESRTKELEESNHELESFTYSVSHDLRTPLRGIDGFSRILLDKYSDEFDEQGKDYLQRVRAGAQRMGQLINDMLQLSRASREEIKLQLTNLSIIAVQAIKELQQAEPDRDIEMLIEPDLQANSDPKQIRIVLDNLLGNAWKFTSKRDNAKIEFGLYSDTDTNETIYFVRDNGAGFDMRYADKLFQVFQRLHRDDEFSGSGVGLSTVARLIKRLGGRIWTESKIDKGTTFYFTLCNKP